MLEVNLLKAKSIINLKAKVNRAYLSQVVWVIESNDNMEV